MGFQTKNSEIGSNPEHILECFPSTQYPVPERRSSPTNEQLRMVGEERRSNTRYRKRYAATH